ncbi:mechanosensitive ion channel family protein [Lysinibacter cavernae]|uniref:Small-conductance mechanosensitive channel n=1 Tax=Lysinibacter cavernae TaxID=1640652 RepID=A0A7X5QZ03_9MICO|nr:mechanosensitive ion channel domain-containing protein [Lysinibacter cavernae]NIH52605.1 small-conductance mechanosensitive channel [Lysinibacter cavernae]
MDWIESLFDTSKISGWDALFAVLILLVGIVVAHFAKRAVHALATKFPGLHPELISLTARIVKYAIILLAIGIDLALLGANIQPLLAAVILVAAIGFLALRGIASNFGAAVIIQSRRSIHLGQEIEVLGFIGTVKQLNSRAVVIATRDGQTIHIPNVDILSNPWVNHSEMGSRRTSVEVRVVLNEPVERVLAVIVDSAAETHGVHKKHPTTAITRSLSTDLAIFELRVWHAPLNEPATVSAVVASVHEALDAAGYRSTVVWPVPAQALTVPAQP